MLYRIFAFDGLALTNFRTRQMEDNMGTGDALTSYMQLPGGYYDHYGDYRSPQAVRPIVQEGELFGDDYEDLKDQLLALRSKIGVLGKLTIEFLDNTLYWQWARLVQVTAPSSKNNILSLPIVLTFETSAQIWFRTVVSPVEWTWGDLSWTFGDGTAAIGESGTSAAFTATGGGGQIFTVAHSGNITATNVAVSLTAGTNSITAYRYINQTTGDTFRMGSLTIASGETLTVNGGDRSVWLFGVPANITAITNTDGTSATIFVTNSLTAGDYVRIRGAGVYNGIHKVLTANASQFTFANTYTRGASLSSTGTVEKATSQYSYFATHKGQWPTLAPGDNTIYFTNVFGNAATDATIGWEFYEHYA
jgi:hypothetical protein